MERQEGQGDHHKLTNPIELSLVQNKFILCSAFTLFI